MKKLIPALFVVLLIKVAPAQITVNNAIVPQYMQGLSGTNNDRVPIYFWVEISGLTPGATYRYYTLMDSLNAAAGSNGAGILMMVNMPNATFRRSTTASLSNPLQHDSLIADAGGAWMGWMGVEPSGNARFTPGNILYPKIMFNNGAGGTAVATRVLLDQHPVQVINWGTTPANNLQGSFFYDSTNVEPKDIVFLYENTAGTGRPVASAAVEDEGVDQSAVPAILNAYSNLVDDFPYRWGAIIPNDLPNGIQRIEYRNFSDAAVQLALMDADGLWCWQNTANPSNGSSALRIRSLEGIPNPVIQTASSTVCPTDILNLNATGTGTITWYDIAVGGSVLATGNSVNLPADVMFYAQSDTNGCSSARDSVEFTLAPTLTAYIDNDNDGYGDLNNPVIVCTLGPGIVSDTTDCDDNNFNVNPGASELCNGIDDNCDGQIDEGCVYEPEISIGYPNDFSFPLTLTDLDTIAHRMTLSVFCYANEDLIFTIRNFGNDTLHLDIPVTMTSTSNAITFSIAAQPADLIFPSDSTILIIHMLASSNYNIDSAKVTIGNDDLDENPLVLTIVTDTYCGNVNEHDQNLNATLFPVPSNDNCTLLMKDLAEGDVNVSIMTMDGRSVSVKNYQAATGDNQFILDVASLGPGVYLVHVKTTQGNVVRRLIKE